MNQTRVELTRLPCVYSHMNSYAEPMEEEKLRSLRVRQYLTQERLGVSTHHFHGCRLKNPKLFTLDPSKVKSLFFQSSKMMIPANPEVNVARLGRFSRIRL